MNKIKKSNILIIASKTDSGKRLDKFISESTDLSRQRIANIINEGNVIINKEVITSKNYKLKGLERLTINIPEIKDLELKPEAIPLNILYEDEDILVIDKQHGLVVHPGAGITNGTLVNAILHHCNGSLSGIGGYKRPGIVHRLDKETSGIMIIAKNDKSHISLSEQFADHGRTGYLERSYLAIIWGIPRILKSRIENRISRNENDRTKMNVTMNDKKGKIAITDYEVLEKYNGYKNDPLASLIRCKLYTGRTHQIRVHMAHMGHPILNDSKYGKGFLTKMTKLSHEDQEIILNQKRHALHAEMIKFTHPSSKKILNFNTELPDDLLLLKNMLSK
tara:strand:+ start:10685 stop:11689 length:1005 start_codon:yes stop_codon:yes gene_type:complete